MGRKDVDFDEEPAEANFETWAHEGGVYHAVGLLQMWRRGYTPWENRYDEPPVLKPEFSKWLTDNGCEFLEFVGSPHIKFPNIETAEKFKAEWHDPGEAYKWPPFISDPQNILSKAQGLPERVYTATELIASSIGKWPQEVEAAVQELGITLEEFWADRAACVKRVKQLL